MKEYDITGFGAVSDVNVVSTVSIQKAIDECELHGGGTVVVRNGTYVTGTLYLKSNIELRIEAGAVLLASADVNDYPELDCGWDISEAPRRTAKCLIYIGNCENTAITGLGTINCNGKNFCEPNPKAWIDENDPHVQKRLRRTTNLVPARMIFAMNSRNITFKDFTMIEMAGGWGSWINHCEYVNINRIKMYCHPYYPNADGIHINCSKDVFVTDCAIHSGDDCIIVRANTNTLHDEDIPCENVLIKGCSLSSYCNAVRIGWRNDGAIKNCVFSDLIITNSRDALTIEMPFDAVPSDTGRNITRIENISFTNIVIDSTDRYPVHIAACDGNHVDYIKNIKFCGISSKSSRYPLLQGRKDMHLENISFHACRFMVTDMAEKGFHVRYVKNLRISADFDAE